MFDLFSVDNGAVNDALTALHLISRPIHFFGNLWRLPGDHRWNVTCIAKDAKDPQRIFDLWTYLLTPEAAVLQEYGPQGYFWDTLDENGVPDLKKPEADFATDEIDEVGTWFWMCPGQSDNVDKLKFAVNSKQPKDKQNWVANNQEKLITPKMWISDEFVNIDTTIDGQSDLGIKRTTCEDTIKAQFPKIITAGSAEESEKLYNDLISFLDQNGMPEIESTYNAKYQENVKAYGTGLKK